MTNCMFAARRMSRLMSKDQELIEAPLSTAELAGRYRDLCYDRVVDITSIFS